MDAGTLSAFGAYMNLGYRMGFLPYHLSSQGSTKLKSESGSSEDGQERKKWIFNDSPRRRYFLYFLMTMAGLYQVFLVTRTVQVFNDEEISEADKLKVFYLTATYIILNYFHVLTVSFYGEHAKYVNAVLDLGHNFKGEVKCQWSMLKLSSTLSICLKF